ncbi:hypothetical protein M0M42_03345 [Pseudomonas knackmussii]|uniref:Secreted protein n=1 Tax=Pseudomonas knackmussii TaxID=65741 RepID=A0ABY4KRH6_9PSED|nr:hypothetical protein [Pseudomonas knackmussii]UPQ83457.1 hypothetical protein M0M42_03345 [Pseudomonas knackmussii]
MNKTTWYFTLLLGLLASALAHADDRTPPTLLEMADVTIHIAGGNPYGELRPCMDCPPRLLPFTPDAQLYINGRKLPQHSLQAGQHLTGTVFLRSQPIYAISEIVVK